MKIGILAQYLDTRPDISELINRLSEEHEVVVFQKRNDPRSPLLKPSVAIRFFSRTLSTSHKIWNVLFKAFGKIPVSKHNYFITEDFKIQNSPSYGANWRTWWNKWLLWLNYNLPGFISYDFFIGKMQNSVVAELEDIDVFLCYSQIYDDGFFGQLVEKQKKIYVLVYSWDHPCKMKCFSRQNVQYLVWNTDIENDMVALQGIDRNRIRIVGTSQFGYLKKFMEAPDRKSLKLPFPYLYFAFSTGTLSLALQEIAVIRTIAPYLAKHWPEAKLMLRAYPFFKQKQLYNDLLQLGNIVFETDAPAGSDVYGKMRHKYQYMDHAVAFLHFGTTLGVEATFLDAPVFFLSLKQEKLEPNLYYFIHQYQNDAYLHKANLVNTIEKYTDLDAIIPMLKRKDPELLAYNQAVTRTFSCETFEVYSDRIGKMVTEEPLV